MKQKITLIEMNTLFSLYVHIKSKYFFTEQANELSGLDIVLFEIIKSESEQFNFSIFNRKAWKIRKKTFQETYEKSTALSNEKRIEEAKNCMKEGFLSAYNEFFGARLFEVFDKPAFYMIAIIGGNSLDSCLEEAQYQYRFINYCRNIKEELENGGDSDAGSN